MASKKHLSPTIVAALVAGTFGFAPPAMAFTPVSELKDVAPDHWAYASIQSLIEKYALMGSSCETEVRTDCGPTRLPTCVVACPATPEISERTSVNPRFSLAVATLACAAAIAAWAGWPARRWLTT